MEGSDEKGGLQRIIPSFSNDGQLGINGKMQNLSVDVNNNNNGSNFGNMNNSNNGNFSGGNSVRRSVGIPPSYPQARMGGGGAQNFTMGASAMHSRSVSQPSFSNFDHLPPLSPSTATFRDLPSSSNDNVNVVGLGLPGGGVSGVGSVGGGGGVNEGLPPRRGGHRRSSSDVPLGFAGNSMSQQTLAQFTSGPAAKPAQLVMKRDAEWGGSGSGDGEGGGEKKGEGELADDLILQYMNFDNMDGLNSSSMEDKDSRASCTRTNDSSENEVESSGGYGASSSYTGERGKRSAPEDVAHSGRHVRSLSMDSLMGNLNFNDESPKLPPSPGFRSAQHSPSNSFDGNANKFNLEFGNGEFNAAEMKKIMANEKLAEMARADPKRVKRILSNRVSAARSKERKMRYISELEHKVQTLQTEATTLSTQLTLLQRDSVGLTSQNNELKFRLQSMQQQAQLRDALNEALTAEVQRLKLATGERRGEPSPNFLPQQLMANHIFQMQPSQYMYQLQQQQHNQQQLQQNNQQQLQQNNQNQQQLQQNNQQPQQNWSAQSDQEAEARKS